MHGAQHNPSCAQIGLPKVRPLKVRPAESAATGLDEISRTMGTDSLTLTCAAMRT